MISKNSNAEMIIYFSDDPAAIINDCIKRNNVKHIVFGNSDIKEMSFEEQYAKIEEIEIHICNYK